jgi:hypothetical protein
MGSIAVPPSHERCQATPCLLCGAVAHMTTEDWKVMDFYRIVSDQVVNLTPGEDVRQLVPRLEAWIAAADLAEVPRSSRALLIEQARVIFDGANDRIVEHGLHKRPLADFDPPVLN